MKKRLIIIACIIAGVCVLGTGGWFGLQKLNKATVKVYSVSDLAQGYWGDPMNLNGMISSDVSQDVHLTDKQIVDEVFVSEGDQVDVGDPLLSYDMTLVNIELEVEKLNKESLEIQKKGTEQEIEKLKKQEPVAESSAGGGEKKGASKTAFQQEAEGGFTRLTAPLKEESQPGSGEEEQNPGDEKPTPEQPDPDEDPEKKDPSKDKEEIKAADRIDENSKPYKGTGTKEDPYIYLCKENPILMGSFLNMLGGFGEEDTKTLPEKYAQLEIREGDTAEGLLLTALFLDGRKIVEKCVPEEEYQIRLSAVKSEEPQEDPEGDDEFWDIGDEISGDDIIAGYTKEELEKAIQEKQKDMKKLELDIKESNLKIQKISSKLENQTIKSTIKGTVKAVGDPEKGEIDGKPFIQVVSSEGLYVRGSVSELMLDKVKPGQMLTGSSMETGTPFEAEIKEISPYPSSNNMFGGGGNSNVSYYPFTAYIAQAEGLKNQEYVSLQADVDTGASTDAIFLQKPFVRTEDGKSYVYCSVKGRLKKQEIVTGKTVWGSLIEIKSGITQEDKLAFPYGKTVKENAKTKDASVDELYY
jgi:HlyD family secretion protein